MTVDKPTLRKLRDLLGGSDDDLMELIQSFLEEAPELVSALEAARKSGDIAVARRTAHSLKSNCKDFGAFHASELLTRIEHTAAEGAMPADTDIDMVCAEIGKALQELEAVLSVGTI